MAVTGSVGKTATKDAIALVLAEHKNVRATKGNYNNEVGVPLTLIGKPSPGRSVIRWILTLLYGDWLIIKRHPDFPKVFVLEYGADKPGDIDALCRLAPPNVSVVTAVGAAHTEAFGSVQMVAKEKARLVANLPKDGTAILNIDEPFVLAMRAATSAHVLTYGLQPLMCELFLRVYGIAHSQRRGYRVACYVQLGRTRSNTNVSVTHCRTSTE